VQGEEIAERLVHVQPDGMVHFSHVGCLFLIRDENMLPQKKNIGNRPPMPRRLEREDLRAQGITNKYYLINVAYRTNYYFKIDK
jgi:hypothetical protein